MINGSSLITIYKLNRKLLIAQFRLVWREPYYAIPWLRHCLLVLMCIPNIEHEVWCITTLSAHLERRLTNGLTIDYVLCI